MGKKVVMKTARRAVRTKSSGFRSVILSLSLPVLAAGILTAQQGRPNILKNASFEEGQQGWDFSSWNKKGQVSVDNEVHREGRSSIRIENPAGGDDSFLTQTVPVKPKTRYRLTGYIMTKDVQVKGTGATLSLFGGFEKTESITGDQRWKKVELEFETGPLQEIKIGPRLGHNSSMAAGVAWFDELELVELGPSRDR